jgi:hypothetical protein
LLTPGTRSRNIGLFYGQGYSVVKYLVETYGPEKFAQMIAVFNRTGQIDVAFQEAFGADQTGIYRQWREKVGLTPDQSPPQTAPDGAPAAAPSSDATIVLIAAASVLLMLLLGAAIAGGLLLARRARSA